MSGEPKQRVMAGDLYAWGANHVGQLGLGVGEDVSVPARVPDLPGLVSVDGSGCNGYVLDENGDVWSWGWNFYGLLGTGNVETTEPEIVPPQLKALGVTKLTETYGTARPARIPGLPAITAIACGEENTFALDHDGHVWAWGNWSGLGRHAKKASNTPQKIEGLSDIVSLHMNSECLTHFAIDRNRDVWSWGFGTNGELGHGKPRNAAIPERMATLSGVRNVAAVPFGALAVLKDGSVWGWGLTVGDFGIVFDGEFVPEPIRLEWLEKIEELIVGTGAAIARNRAGDTFAWGESCGELLGDVAPDSVIPQKAPQLDRWRHISLGDDHGLAVDADGNLLSFGESENGALGNGDTKAEWGPTVVEGVADVICTNATNDQSLVICRHVAAEN